MLTLDILASRRLNELEAYFYQFSREQRLAVKYVVVDMYSPYFSLVKKLFPKADIVIDRFHIYQHLNRAFIQSRIGSMKDFPTNSKEYRHLKHYWKLMNMSKFRLDIREYRYQPSFKMRIV